MSATHLRTDRRVARREHCEPCFLCGLPIRAGDAYDDSAWAADGRAYSIREHAGCREAILAVMEPWELDERGYGRWALDEYDDDDLPPAWVAWRNARQAETEVDR